MTRSCWIRRGGLERKCLPGMCKGPVACKAQHEESGSGLHLGLGDMKELFTGSEEEESHVRPAVCRGLS